jgi:death-on-curing protein
VGITTPQKDTARKDEKRLSNQGSFCVVHKSEWGLDSTLSATFQIIDDAELYPSTAAKIARIAYGLVCNHPFADGNKRIGTYVMAVLSERNKIEVEFTDDDIIHIGLELANGKMSDKQLLDLILECSK